MRSLAYRSERAIIDFEGETAERADYWVCRSPRAPLWYWGNLLIFKRPPGRWSRHEWTEAFRREFHDLPVNHMSLAWDSPNGDFGELAPFSEVGFTPFECDVLRGAEVAPPPRANPDVVVRPVSTDADYEAVTVLQQVTRPSDMSAAVYHPFLEQRVGGMRRWAEAGQGAVMGAFFGGSMVACLGLFAWDDADGVRRVRYQSVVVGESVRRRGICGRLVADSGSWAREHLGAEELVITAEKDSSAGRIYARCGFVHREQQVGMLRRPRSDGTTD